MSILIYVRFLVSKILQNSEGSVWNSWWCLHSRWNNTLL